MTLAISRGLSSPDDERKAFLQNAGRFVTEFTASVVQGHCRQNNKSLIFVLAFESDTYSWKFKVDWRFWNKGIKSDHTANFCRFSSTPLTAYVHVTSTHPTPPHHKKKLNSPGLNLDNSIWNVQDFVIWTYVYTELLSSKQCLQHVCKW